MNTIHATVTYPDGRREHCTFQQTPLAEVFPCLDVFQRGSFPLSEVESCLLEQEARRAYIDSLDI